MLWKLVPVEPTTIMENSAVDATEAGSGMSWNGMSPQKLFRIAHTAMLASAPPASQDEALVGKVAEAIWKCKYGPGNRMAAERIARAVLKMLEADHG